jgi:radical SAM protein with 4Fe4S-binding SPASM domain
VGLVSEPFVSSANLPEFPLRRKIEGRRALISFDLELTARCNNNCRHCYINVPAEDKAAKERELSIEEIDGIAGEAVSLGAFWCLITGGEPLLREDFFDIYLRLKKKGLLLSIFTNATLVTEEHVKLFKKYPPRDIEVSVYGVSRQTYERVTRRPGSFAAFRQGLNLLMQGGLNVRLKAMVLRSNVHEQPTITRFCKERTKQYFRFDPFLHLRYDGDPARNRQIESERLSPHGVVAVERSDPGRFRALEKECEKLVVAQVSHTTSDQLFHCGLGTRSFSLSYDGLFRLCPPLWHPDCLYNLKKGTLTEAWNEFVPRVRETRSERSEFLSTCRLCPLINLCMWCPAHAHLETGELDGPVPYFCQVAEARAQALKIPERFLDIAHRRGTENMIWSP